MVEEALKIQYSYKFKVGARLLLELNSGEIYQCNFQYGDPDHLQVLNTTLNDKEQIIDGEMLKFYVGEIVSITVLSGNYTPEELKALKPKPPETNYAKRYYDLGIKARNYMFIDKLGRNFFDAIEHIKSITAISVIGEGGQFGRKIPISILGIGTNIQMYIFDIKRTGQLFFDSGLREILSDAFTTKIVCNSRMLADNLTHRHDVQLNNIFDVQVSDFQLIQRNKKEPLTEMRPLADIVQDYLLISQRCALRSQVNPKQIVDRPVQRDVAEHIAMNAACLYLLKDIMQTELKPNYKLIGQHYLDSLRDMDYITEASLKEDSDPPDLLWSLEKDLF